MASNIKVDKRQFILETAARLFVDKGYNTVTFFQIATEAKLKEKDIQKEFATKEELRQELFDLYEKIYVEARPDIDKILECAKTEHPFVVLKMLDYEPPKDKINFLTHILLTALQDFRTNFASRKVVRDNTIGYSVTFVKIVLDRLIELNKIAPLNSAAVARLAGYHNFANSILERTSLGTAREEWHENIEALMGVIRLV